MDWNLLYIGHPQLIQYHLSYHKYDTEYCPNYPKLNDSISLIFIACIIGLTQLFGHDILGTEVSRILIAGEQMIETNFKPGQVYQTVYNMNYVGMYLALVIPILLITIYISYKLYKSIIKNFSIFYFILL